MKMSNKTYDRLVWVAQIVLPAVVAFVATIGKIWSLPYYVEVSATIAAIDTLLGACLKYSSSNYIPEDDEDGDEEYEDTDDVRDDIEVRDNE